MLDDVISPLANATPDEPGMVVADLDYRVAVKPAADPNGWAIVCLVQNAIDGPRHHWPVDLMKVAVVGDELWWFRSSAESWENLCGSAGWALVRDGKVIGTHVTMMN